MNDVASEVLQRLRPRRPRLLQDLIHRLQCRLHRPILLEDAVGIVVADMHQESVAIDRILPIAADPTAVGRLLAVVGPLVTAIAVAAHLRDRGQDLSVTMTIGSSNNNGDDNTRHHHRRVEASLVLRRDLVDRLTKNLLVVDDVLNRHHQSRYVDALLLGRRRQSLLPGQGRHGVDLRRRLRLVNVTAAADPCHTVPRRRGKTLLLLLDVALTTATVDRVARVQVVNVVGLIRPRPPRHRPGVAGAVMTRVGVLIEVVVVAIVVHHHKTITSNLLEIG